ncbi:hypothetical protein [Vibrio phage vB_VmeM-Yong XC32]|nr:hypothetical protein [Vibrio phage vB_VmeM-Yong XC31]QAX96576.1 hypothetical protein [Vibrio phage vB_VmeM-Yong XC32]QAX96894.1 hypothetical protein [Vibrio phage vB_VmeM-Yong MS31]QAX97199.1 hypothetical protein [Vibrio phage vB_VmeM-Yong MS32]
MEARRIIEELELSGKAGQVQRFEWKPPYHDVKVAAISDQFTITLTEADGTTMPLTFTGGVLNEDYYKEVYRDGLFRLAIKAENGFIKVVVIPHVEIASMSIEIMVAYASTSADFIAIVDNQCVPELSDKTCVEGLMCNYLPLDGLEWSVARCRGNKCPPREYRLLTKADKAAFPYVWDEVMQTWSINKEVDTAVGCMLMAYRRINHFL